jgi:hypothetical protein
MVKLPIVCRARVTCTTGEFAGRPGYACRGAGGKGVHRMEPAICKQEVVVIMKTKTVTQTIFNRFFSLNNPPDAE